MCHINLYIALGSMAILTIFFQLKNIGYLSISMNYLLFPLLMFYGSQHMSSTSLVRFVPVYFNCFMLFLKGLLVHFWYFIVSVK